MYVPLPEKDAGTGNGPPTLGYVSSGSQSHVFGTSKWVINVRRYSLFRALSAFVSTRSWLEQVQEKLHGVVAPFAVIGAYRFRGRLPGKELRECRGDYAIVKPRFSPEQFLDYKIEKGSPEQQLGYVLEMVQLLEKLHARGFHMLDFIRRNFVYAGERLHISDPGLIIPLKYMREPTMRVAAICFGMGLTKDYMNVLSDASERAGEGEVREKIEALKAELPARIKALRKRNRSVNEEDWISVEFPEGLKQDILRSVRP